MFDRIIVPLNGSAFAEAALVPARQLALRFGSKLLLTTAVEPLGLPPVHTDEAPPDTGEELEVTDVYLREQVEKLRRDGFTSDMALYVANAGAAIAGTAELTKADLVVIATRMAWTLPTEGRHRSSVTLDLLARSRIPILSCHLVPGSTIPVELAGPDLPIVVPLDGSPFAEQALSTAQAIASAFGAYLVLVRAVPEDEASTGQKGDTAHNLREARDYLAELRSKLQTGGMSVITIAEPGIAINVIEHTWREHGAGLIVMASHGQSGDRARQTDRAAARSGLPSTGPLVGSVAAEILEELEVPALVIQPEQEESK
jgi:nucleotide-binding universal stress UspA family protein